MSDRTNIFLTIDVECKRYANNLIGPVYGRIADSREAYGLDFILAVLKRYKLKATFFVEPFLSYRFGIFSLRRICEAILSAKQDIQLHMHPFFKADPNKNMEDKLYAYTFDEQVELINEAKKMLIEDCGVKEIHAFRAGSFTANNDTYEALKACNIEISSNYNLDYLRKSCRIDIPVEHNDIFRCEGGILEMPITCFNEFNLLKLAR